MTIRLFRSRAIVMAATMLAAPLAVSSMLATPAHAQFGRIVFDPSNYAQNILTAARTLEQINHQITSLQNEATMLMNQARNLASLPFSSLQQLQQNVQRTQQLLSQAQNIAFDVQRIDQAFQQQYGNVSMSATDQQARRQRSHALAEHRRRLAGRHARSGRRRRQHRQQPHADVGAWSARARTRPARSRRRKPATSF